MQLTRKANPAYAPNKKEQHLPLMSQLFSHSTSSRMASGREEAKSSLKNFNRATLHILKRMLEESQKRNSTSFPTLQRAYISLKACPVPFRGIDDLSQLSGFESDAFREELGVRLRIWCDRKGKTLSTSLIEQSGWSPGIANAQASSSGKPRQKQSTLSSWNADESATKEPTQKATRTKKKKVNNSEKDTSSSTSVKQYIPQHRTGTHGILVALYGLTPIGIHTNGIQSNNEDEKYFSKSVIISHAQTFSDAKYIPAKAPPGFGHSAFSFHSAWSGMKTLINRGYVFRKGNPAKFGLSKEGLHVARTCAEKETDIMPGCFAEEEESRQQIAPSEDNAVRPVTEQASDVTASNSDARKPDTKKRRRDLLEISSLEGEIENRTTISSSSHSKLLRPSNRTENDSTSSNTVKSHALPATPINLISSDDMEMSKENRFQATSLESPSPLSGRQHRRRVY